MWHLWTLQDTGPCLPLDGGRAWPSLPASGWVRAAGALSRASLAGVWVLDKEMSRMQAAQGELCPLPLAGTAPGGDHSYSVMVGPHPGDSRVARQESVLNLSEPPR